MTQGVIFDIKEFAVFDGPGIRQTVFLKGCPLACGWCHNPEGLRMQPQIMATKTVCRFCQQSQYVLASNICAHCGNVLPVLPRITGEKVEANELVRRIRRHSDYYARYGGGVTFSGGEPLMQPLFLLEVLAQIPDLHCAIETSGYCRPEVFAEVITEIDYVMFDLKLFDSTLHQQHTGKPNDRILHNARILCQGNTPFVIRIPLIPGITDTEDNLVQIAQFIQGARSLLKVELLPYHRTAGAKYPLVGLEYQPGFDDTRLVQGTTAIFTDFGIRSDIL